MSKPELLLKMVYPRLHDPLEMLKAIESALLMNVVMMLILFGLWAWLGLMLFLVLYIALGINLFVVFLKYLAKRKEYLRSGGEL